MPELPEVETMVRGIRAIEGRAIRDFVACDCDFRPISIEPDIDRIRDRACGKTIVSVSRRAKRVVLELETGDRFVIEPRMTGLMLLTNPPDVEHLRFEWHLAGKATPPSVWFWDRRGLGTIRLFSPAEYSARLDPPALGPDALGMTDSEWYAACTRTSRAIKVALLDQTLVAGIGNLYASEILHRAKVSPRAAANRLSRSRIARIAGCAREILLEAISYEGSTLSDGTYRNALNREGGYQSHHRVYDRADESCPTCEQGIIGRIVQNQRSTFYCPRCQAR